MGFISIWATTWENVPLDSCAQLRFKSACAFAQSYQCFRCSHKEILRFGYSKCAQRRFWSDCANAQWSESWLGARVQRHVLWRFGSYHCTELVVITSHQEMKHGCLSFPHVEMFIIDDIEIWKTGARNKSSHFQLYHLLCVWRNI